jgi:serine phosphatase RsbU (regulator of sigma subunit)
LPPHDSVDHDKGVAGVSRPHATSIWTSPADGALLGGDWSDIIPISENVIALSIGDVSGHGAAVADTMLAMRASVLDAIRHGIDPAAILATANVLACTLGDESIVTAVVAFYDSSTSTLTFANAGHPPPLLLTRDRSRYLMRRRANLPLGVFRRYRASICSFVLPPDALLVLYTDGITEHDRDPIAGEAELIDAAGFAFAHPDLDAARIVAGHILSKIRGHDDAAVMVLRTAPAAHATVRYAREARGTASRRLEPDPMQ